MGTSVDYLIKVLADTSDADKELKGFGPRAKKALMAGGAIAATALAAGFVASVNNAMNMEATNDKIAAQLGLTEGESERAGGAAAAAYSNAFGDSIESVQQATAGIVGSIAGMRDASVEELQGITEKVLTLSSGFELEADRISQITGQLLTTGLASSAEEGLDLLTAALQKVPPAVRADLVDAVDEYAPFFAQIGISGEAAMSALVAASEDGMYGIDKTGDALKEFTIRATDMSTSSVAAYDALGLSAEDMSAALLAGGEEGAKAFDTIVEGLVGMDDPLAQSQAALALFGTPLEDLGTSEIPAFLGSLGNLQGGLGDTQGAAQAMADQLGGNTATTWTSFLRSIEMVGTEIASHLLPVLQPMIEWISENTWVIQILAAALAVLAIGFIGVTVATWAMNTALLASPVTWIILGIVALIAAIILLITNWDAVVKFLTDVWGNFVGWLTDVLDGLGSWWNDFWTGIGQFVQQAWQNWIVNPIKSAVLWLWNTIQNALKWIREAWSNTWNGLGQVVRGIWNGILGWIEGGVNGAIGIINGLITAANLIPGVEIPIIPNVHIPRLAQGGVTTGPTLALIGDNPGGREVVSPLDRYESQMERAFNAGARSRPDDSGYLKPGDRITVVVEGTPLTGVVRRELTAEARRSTRVLEAGSKRRV